MSGQMDKCRECGTMIFYADEKVVGTLNGEPNTRFDVLESEQYENGVPDGYSVYCLDCAPCECGLHPDLMSDRAAVKEGWCFKGDCEGELAAHKTDDHPCSHCFNPKFDCACSDSDEYKSVADRATKLTIQKEV